MVILETNIFITKLVFRINIVIGFENIEGRGKEKMPPRLYKSEVSLYLSKYWFKIWRFLKNFIKRKIKIHPNIFQCIKYLLPLKTSIFKFC